MREGIDLSVDICDSRSRSHSYCPQVNYRDIIRYILLVYLFSWVFFFIMLTSKLKSLQRKSPEVINQKISIFKEIMSMTKFHWCGKIHGAISDRILFITTRFVPFFSPQNKSTAKLEVCGVITTVKKKCSKMHLTHLIS